MVSTAQFRGDFPALSDPQRFPDDVISFWLNVATFMVANVDRWADLLNLGQELFAAHHTILDVYNQDTVNNGGIPGLNRGVISGESAGPVNLSYDTAASAEDGEGHWNLTTYGTRFIRLSKMVGAGPVYVGGCGISPLYNGPAWAGPWTAYTPTQSG